MSQEEKETVEELQSEDGSVESVEAVEEEVVEKTAEQLEIERLQSENDVLADKVLRAQAELQNVQRRQAKERGDLIKYRSQKLAEAVLPVLDSLERALAIEVSDEHGENLKKGIEMAYNTFVNALKEEGIEKIDALGQSFDPTKHQAIQQVPAQDGQNSDEVTQVFQEGYILHERVIRPAMVVVTA